MNATALDVIQVTFEEKHVRSEVHFGLERRPIVRDGLSGKLTLAFGDLWSNLLPWTSKLWNFKRAMKLAMMVSL